MASWNLAGREIIQTRTGGPAAFQVNGLPLISYHFSGTGPTGTHRRVREIFDPGNAAVAEIERLYEQAIARHGQTELENRAPGYDFFDDGTPITPAARRLYRRHADLRNAFPDPYACPTDQPSYRDWLRANRPGAVAGLSLALHRLEQAYLDLFDADFYLDRYPKARAAIAAGTYRDALDHYERIGARQFHDTNPFFVSSYYFEQAGEHDPWRLSAHAGRRE